MALNEEILNSQPELSTLTPEQKTAIAQLSKNDEDVVIGKRIGELHGAYDNDVLTVTGVAKNNGEKSYDYVKRVLGDFKSQTEGLPALNKQITDLTAEIGNYKKQIEDGKGNELIAQQLKDANAKLTQLQGQYETEKGTWGKEKDELVSKHSQTLVNLEFGKSTVALKFKKEYPESVQQTLVEAAQNKILSAYKPEFSDKNGKQVMIFRDKDGNVLNNPENKLEPYTAAELMAKELKDVLDLGKGQPGAGTNPPGGGGGNDYDVTDVASAKTQVEADEIIVNYLLKKGVERGSAEFQKQQTEIRKQYDVGKLPMR